MGSHRQSLWTNTLFSFAAPIAVGAACTGSCCVLFSALTFFILGTMQFTGVFTAVSAAAGGVVSGYICGKYRRRRGLADGIICGGVLGLMLAAAAVAVTGDLPAVWKLILLLIAGAVGGVMGVNSKRPKNLM